MKAVLYERYGAPEVALHLKEIGKPVPRDRQVLIKVRAASLNAKEWRGFTMPLFVVRLFGGGWSKPKDPSIGTDAAGVVEAVGENVTRFKPGDEVFGGANGSFAEYALARDVNLALKPANRSFAEAAALPIAGLTALQAIRYAGGIRTGQQVLIQGASGGIGMFAVQMANAAGAEVTAVCSTRNLDLARSWGADQVIDYTREDFTKSGRQYDLILGVNGYHPLRAYRRALKPQGVYVCAGGELSQLFQAILFGKWFSQKGGRRLGSMGVAKFNPADLEHLGELLKDGALAPSIDRQFPLEETVNAIRYVIDHHAQGKIVLTMG